tara:strand:- start:151 stop:312 length:162 start_codon:yes stop_codon:yes gene_type:complete
MEVEEQLQALVDRLQQELAVAVVRDILLLLLVVEQAGVEMEPTVELRLLQLEL